MFLIGITGFCVKPLRDSGAITVPELLERQFGPRIRWLAGVVIVLGGLLNMGAVLAHWRRILTPAVVRTPSNLVTVMTVLLIGAAAYTILGGMLLVLITDFLQFVVKERRRSAGGHVSDPQGHRVDPACFHGGVEDRCRRVQSVRVRASWMGLRHVSFACRLLPL
ncbi:MAG: hypothetical protein U0992_04870 [Planctomycetaceae bacterium]